MASIGHQCSRGSIRRMLSTTGGCAPGPVSVLKP
jgi:hypothetical protein